MTLIKRRRLKPVRNRSKPYWSRKFMNLQTLALFASLATTIIMAWQTMLLREQLQASTRNERVQAALEASTKVCFRLSNRAIIPKIPKLDKANPIYPPYDDELERFLVDAHIQLDFMATWIPELRNTVLMAQLDLIGFFQPPATLAERFDQRIECMKLRGDLGKAVMEAL